MKIFEYKPNLGTLSLGLERFPQNEVVEVANLSKIASFSYNNTHKQWFLPNFSNISEYETENDYDLAILHPFLGEKIGRKGKSNFQTADLTDCLRFLEYERPEFAIITVDPNAVELLNCANSYVRDGFGEVSRDMVIDNLQKMGYKAHFVALDEASYGVPVHKYIAMYVATPNDFDMKFPIGLYNRYGRGKYNRYRTIADAIGDLEQIGEWVPYKSEPQNVYQRYIRRGMERITWNFHKRKLSADKKSVISHIPQGSNAKKTKNVDKKVGYVRPRWDRICPVLDEKFYTISSRGPSVHPLKDRPFTIREGMRIMGLPDNISFDLKDPYQEVARLVVNSVSPTIGEALAIALKAIS